MIQPYQSKYLTPTKEFRRLALLLSIHHAPKASQHQIAKGTHLSSSMVNNYIKLLKQEKLITISGKTNRTQSYHLTAQGADDLRASLLAYSAEIVQLYASVKLKITQILNGFFEEGIRTIVLFGVAETAEVVHAALKDTRLVMIGVVDSDAAKQGKPFNGLFIQSPDQLKQIMPDAVVITSFARQEEIHHDVQRLVGKEIKVKKLSDL
jgi:predicted transcriptional regulator